jgi:hypothetical protein
VEQLFGLRDQAVEILSTDQRCGERLSTVVNEEILIGFQLFAPHRWNTSAGNPKLQLSQGESFTISPSLLALLKSSSVSDMNNAATCVRAILSSMPHVPHIPFVNDVGVTNFTRHSKLVVSNVADLRFETSGKQVIAINAAGSLVVQLPVTTTFTAEGINENGAKLQCGTLDRTTGTWRTDRCTVNSASLTSITCSCTQAATYAVLAPHAYLANYPPEPQPPTPSSTGSEGQSSSSSSGSSTGDVTGTATARSVALPLLVIGWLTMLLT